MTDKQKVIQAIYTAIDEVNSTLTDSQQLEKTEDEVLYGQSGKLDSLGFVNLIVTIEEEITNAFDVACTLADEKAFSQKNSPFRTVATLANYIESNLSENGK
jgi:acyl carrier protein